MEACFDLVCDQVSGVMRQLGQNPSEAEIQDMVNQVRGGNGHGGYLTEDVDLLFSLYDPRSSWYEGPTYRRWIKTGLG